MKVLWHKMVLLQLLPYGSSCIINYHVVVQLAISIGKYHIEQFNWNKKILQIKFHLSPGVEAWLHYYTCTYTCTEGKNKVSYLCGCDSCTGVVVAATVVAVVVVVGVDCCWGALVGVVVAGVAYRSIMLITGTYIWTMLYTQVHNTAPTCGHTHTHARTHTRTHTHTQTHAYTHTIHTYTHTLTAA